MRGSQCGWRERLRAKRKVVAEDRVFGRIASLLAVQATCKQKMKTKLSKVENGVEQNAIEINRKCLALKIENFIQ